MDNRCEGPSLRQGGDMSVGRRLGTGVVQHLPSLTSGTTRYYCLPFAGVAQSVERRTRNA